MEHNERDLRRYCRGVWNNLPCGWREKKRIVNEIREMAAEFLADRPGAGYSGIVSRFGEPVQIAVSYIQEQDEAALLKQLHVRRRILSVVAAAAAAIVLMWSVIVVYGLWQAHSDINGYSIVTLTENEIPTEGSGTE